MDKSKLIVECVNLQAAVKSARQRANLSYLGYSKIVTPTMFDAVGLILRAARDSEREAQEFICDKNYSYANIHLTASILFYNQAYEIIARDVEAYNKGG